MRINVVVGVFSESGLCTPISDGAKRLLHSSVGAFSDDGSTFYHIKGVFSGRSTRTSMIYLSRHEARTFGVSFLNRGCCEEFSASKEGKHDNHGKHDKLTCTFY